MSYNSGSNLARNFKIWNYSPDYSLNCIPLGPITITNIWLLDIYQSKLRNCGLVFVLIFLLDPPIQTKVSGITASEGKW